MDMKGAFICGVTYSTYAQALKATGLTHDGLAYKINQGEIKIEPRKTLDRKLEEWIEWRLIDVIRENASFTPEIEQVDNEQDNFLPFTNGGYHAYAACNMVDDVGTGYKVKGLDYTDLEADLSAAYTADENADFSNAGYDYYIVVRAYVYGVNNNWLPEMQGRLRVNLSVVLADEHGRIMGSKPPLFEKCLSVYEFMHTNLLEL